MENSNQANQPLSEQTYFILLSLQSHPKHGYAIIQDIQSRSQGRVTLSVSTLYTTLKRLLDNGWIRMVEEEKAKSKRPRKVYELTKTGGDVLLTEVRRLGTFNISCTDCRNRRCNVKKSLSMLTLLYGWVLLLYPRSFRKKFEKEMLLDFKDVLEAASQNGRFALIGVLLHELWDIPGNLLRAYMEDGHMRQIFRSQPLNTGLRSALGFGFTFAITSILGAWVWQNLASSNASIVPRLQVYFVDYFHTEQWFDLISWLPTAVGSLLTGLVFGLLFAILFANHSKYPRYIVVGMLGWFLHDAVRSIFALFELKIFLNDWQYICFEIMMLTVSGAFLGLVFSVAKSERGEPVCLLAIGSFAYPLIAYLYTQQVFDLFVFATSWRFFAMTILWVIFLGGIFSIVVKSNNGSKIHQVVVTGAFGYPLVTYATFYIFQLIFNPVSTGLFANPLFWLYLVMSNAVFGIVIGLLLGAVLGLYTKNDLQQMTV